MLHFSKTYFCSKQNTHVDEWCNEQAEEQLQMFKYWNMVLQLVLCALNCKGYELGKMS